MIKNIRLIVKIAILFGGMMYGLPAYTAFACSTNSGLTCSTSQHHPGEHCHCTDHHGNSLDGAVAQLVCSVGNSTCPTSQHHVGESCQCSGRVKINYVRSDHH